MSEIQHLSRILEICKEGNNEQFHEIALTASLMAMEMVTRIAELEAAASQPLTVIAPPLEWGEWKSRPDLGNDDSSKESLCFRYTIWRRGNWHNSAFGGKCLTWDGTKGQPDPVCTEHEAIAACQAHAQATVNAALEGCNVQPYRDPQGLVDALKWCLTYFEMHEVGCRKRYNGSGYDSDDDEGIHATIVGLIDKWEEKK